jgi:hypothetical protein
MGCVLLFGGHPMEFFEHQPKKVFPLKFGVFGGRKLGSQDLCERDEDDGPWG